MPTRRHRHHGKNQLKGWGPKVSISCTLRNPSFRRALWSGQFWALWFGTTFQYGGHDCFHSEVPFGGFRYPVSDYAISSKNLVVSWTRNMLSRLSTISDKRQTRSHSFPMESSAGAVWSSDHMSMRTPYNSDFFLTIPNLHRILLFFSLNSEFPSHNSDFCFRLFISKFWLCFLAVVSLYLTEFMSLNSVFFSSQNCKKKKKQNCEKKVWIVVNYLFNLSHGGNELPYMWVMQTVKNMKNINIRKSKLCTQKMHTDLNHVACGEAVFQYQDGTF